ncbi:MAG: 5-formyltetrahydrofolate cyclo-ligase [Steroidobacteraceae bacterium]
MALPDSSAAGARRSLRASLRAKRQGISAAERARAARQVAHHANRALNLHSEQRIGIYAATADELDTSRLIALALRRGCRVYLPRIDRRARARTMRFVQLAQGRLRRPLRTNRFGIAECAGPELASARLLDVVFLPLVGFDRCGTRLGMGGGYYDRAFAFRHLRRAWHAPLLVGIAYALQEVQCITPAAHDVPLDLVITERGVIRIARDR